MKKHLVHQGLQFPSLPSPNCSWTYLKTHPVSSSLRHKWERKWSKLKTLSKFPVIIKEPHFQSLQDLIRFRMDMNLNLLEYIKIILAQSQAGTAQGCLYFRNFWTHLFHWYEERDQIKELQHVLTPMSALVQLIFISHPAN